jgi:hypothetical protein
MPFRDAVLVELCNTSEAPVAIDSAVVEYEPGPVEADMCYLHATASATVRAPGQVYHPILSAVGRGHYVGNLLYVEQDEGSFWMLEGDEIVTVDGSDVLAGTGLEDAYNGGYYYNWVGIQYDEPEGGYPQSAIRPLHGILYVYRGGTGARADQYRWLIGERIGFRDTIEVKIESSYGNVGSRWASVAFWYQQPAIRGDGDDDGDVDLADVERFCQCFTGEGGGPVGGGCLFADLDEDGDVDLTDFESFVLMLSDPQ